jgi:hypothetical protein
MGPDSKGRIRILEVEALGGDWAKTRWLAPRVVPQVGGETVRGWNIRGNVGCDANGVLGPHPGYGFEPQLGEPLTVYTWRVPHEFRYGTDRYGRKIIFEGSVNDVLNADGTYTQQKQPADPVLMTDKLTRATRAASGAELAAYLKANPQIKPVPDANTGDSGAWVPTT